MPQRIYTSFCYAAKQPRTYDVLRKDCNSDTKDVYIPHSSFVFQMRLLATRKSRLKLDKVLWRTSTFITCMLKTLYRMSSSDVFSKRHSAADMFHIFRRKPIQKGDFSRVELTRLHGCSPVTWLNVEHLFWKTPLSDCFCIYGSECNICQLVFTCSELT